MWARRCGAPPRWPSRIKVIVFSFFSGTIGLSVYMYMAGSDASYLDLESPASDNVMCFTEWPLRSHAITWSTPILWISEATSDHGSREYHQCPTQRLADAANNTRCSRLVVPVAEMSRPLALAMGEKDNPDILGTWARFFLVMTFLIWVGMTTHDLALIGHTQKNYVLDVSGVNAHCPVIRCVWRTLVGLKILAQVKNSAPRNSWLRCSVAVVCAVLLAPIMLVWNFAVLNFVVCPLILLAFLRYPIRMSRAWVFILCVLCSIYGIVLSLQQLVLIAWPERRPHYALTWEPNPWLGEEEEDGVGCTCGCDYPISFSVCLNLLMIGAGTTVRSFFVAFRCLKGLRRAQWANLLSVTFPVPLTVYPVLWKTPDGHPIPHRTAKMPDPQAEVAFDPFAMMDEQLDSASTTVQLRPVRFEEPRQDGLYRLSEAKGFGNLDVPDKLKGRVQVSRGEEYIGCCGFPWATDGLQGRYMDVDEIADEAHDEPSAVDPLVTAGLAGVPQSAEKEEEISSTRIEGSSSNGSNGVTIGKSMADSPSGASFEPIGGSCNVEEVKADEIEVKFLQAETRISCGASHPTPELALPRLVEQMPGSPGSGTPDESCQRGSSSAARGTPTWAATTLGCAPYRYREKDKDACIQSLHKVEEGCIIV